MSPDAQPERQIVMKSVKNLSALLLALRLPLSLAACRVETKPEAPGEETAAKKNNRPRSVSFPVRPLTKAREQAMIEGDILKGDFL